MVFSSTSTAVTRVGSGSRGTSWMVCWMIVAFAETGVTNRKPMRNTKKTGAMTKMKMTTQVGVSRSSLILKKISQNTTHSVIKTRIAAVMALRSYRYQEAPWVVLVGMAP